MLYGMFRLGIGFIIAIVLFVLIKYTKTIYKRKCCIAAFIAVSITVSLLYLIPFENAFITFSTPEKAFHYTNSWGYRQYSQRNGNKLCDCKQKQCEYL